MAMPTVVAVGAVALGTTNITPGLPTGWAQDDIFVLAVESQNQLVNPPTGYAILNSGTVIVSTGTVTRLTVFWKRATASEVAPTVTDPGNHAIGRIIAVRGCVTSGNPWNITATATELVSDTSVSIPGATTTAADCLILAVFTTGTDVTSTVHVTGWANASLANVVERMDNWTASGLGGGLGMASGEKATAGAYSATTATIVTANFKALMSIALQGASAGAATVQPAVVACAASVPRPAANTTAGPSVTAVTAALPQVSAGVLAVVTPAVVPVLASLARPAANVGAGPAVLPAVAALARPAVNVAAGLVVLSAVAALVRPAVNVAVGPVVVVGIVVLPQTTPVAQSGVTVQPGVVAGVAALARPGVNIGSSPVVVLAVAALPQAAPVTAGNATAQPAALAAVTSLARPAVTVAAGPASVVMLVAVPQPGAGVSVGPAVVTMLVAVPLAVPTIGGVTTPGAMTVIAAAPQPSMTPTEAAQPVMSGRQAVAANMTGTEA